jgi:branched-chain amino acid transport system ATP-binding protein
MLVFNDVCTVYGRIPMLQNVSFTVSKGEIVTILGANGGGKSTTLKTILGLVTPTKGTITFKGEPIHKSSSDEIVKSGISIVPQGGGVFPQMTVERNLILGAFFDKDKKAVHTRLQEMYTLFPRLKERASQESGTLSGGERTMLAIARALIGEPQLLLMDEPSLGLAPVLVDEIFDYIASINKNRGVTILLIEQNANKALTVAHRGYIMQKGSIIYSGTKDELMSNEIIMGSYLC